MLKLVLGWPLMDSQPATGGLSRRNFARTLLGGGTAAALACAAASMSAVGQSVPPEVTPASETEATVARVLARYGSRLDAAQKARLPRIVSGHIAMLEPIRAIAQPNAAPPATVLHLVSGQ